MTKKRPRIPEQNKWILGEQEVHPAHYPGLGHGPVGGLQTHGQLILSQNINI